jgi:pyrroline-5-carboxylate reductase
MKYSPGSPSKRGPRITTSGRSSLLMEITSGEHGTAPTILMPADTLAGCTIDGILELEERKLRVTLIKAVVKAAQRGKELANS